MSCHYDYDPGRRICSLDKGRKNEFDSNSFSSRVKCSCKKEVGIDPAEEETFNNNPKKLEIYII